MIGEQVGEYEIEAQLGEGGMAIVYRARHVVLGTRHAIKVLADDHRANAEIRRRFLDEGKIQAKHLLHPNIVRVTNVLATPAVAGLVMDLVDGGSLERHLAERTRGMTYDEFLAIALPVLDAMAHAHAAGIIHRDLKPANVLLHHGGGKVVPMVADFGIAKIIDPEGLGKSTHHEAKMGTVGYSSPEQIKRAKDVTARSDIFSLGAVFYELLTGVHPFAAASEFEIMEKAVHARFTPPEELVDRSVPIHACAAIRRALSPDPDQRFWSCRDFAEALVRETARETDVVDDADADDAPPVPRGRVLGPLIAGVLVLAAVFAVTAVIYNHRSTAAAPDARVIATLPADAAIDAALGDARIDVPIDAPVPAPPAPRPRPVQPPRPAAAPAAVALDRDDIAAVVNGQLRSQILACTHVSPATGVVRVTVHVLPDGSVASATARQAPDPALGACVEQVMGRARFPGTQQGGTFSYPFVF